jgi:uncharacterized protein YndB with AHSA1/START domain
MSLLTVKTNINAPLSKVWDAFNLPEHIVHWNFASDDWHCPKSEVDFREGGQMVTTMAAKDGSFSFDFTATFDKISPNELVEYTIADGRKVIVTFTEENGIVTVQEDFEAETMNPEEMQQAGWQAILNNFKKYVENA